MTIHDVSNVMFDGACIYGRGACVSAFRDFCAAMGDWKKITTQRRVWEIILAHTRSRIRRRRSPESIFQRLARMGPGPTPCDIRASKFLYEKGFGFPFAPKRERREQRS